MKLFSGKEEIPEYIKRFFILGDFCVIGIGDGCLKAYNHALNSNTRVDTLQLFYPLKAIDLKELTNRGVQIEVYTLEDKMEIVQIMKLYATIYVIKEKL